MIISKKSRCKELMRALKKAHEGSVKYRKSIPLDNEDEMRIAFSFSFRISELLRDIGDIRLKELL